MDPLNKLNDNISKMQTGIQVHSNLLLGQQRAMSDIVNNENNRLIDKQRNIENAYSSQKRAVYLNNNLQKKYNAYKKILIIVFIGALVLFILGLLAPYLTFLPPLFVPIKYIGVISTVVIYSLVIYWDIRKHDPLDYDKLYLKPLSSTGVSGEDTSGNDESDSSSNELTCNNESCCAEGTTWSSITGQCIIQESSSDKDIVDGFRSISPNSQFEYSDYAKY
jgi:hypothetical protein